MNLEKLQQIAEEAVTKLGEGASANDVLAQAVPSVFALLAEERESKEKVRRRERRIYEIADFATRLYPTVKAGTEMLQAKRAVDAVVCIVNFAEAASDSVETNEGNAGATVGAEA